MLPKKLVPGAWAFFAFVLGSLTFAAPLHNATTQVTVSKYETTLGPMTFGTEPRGRGTWGILFSCTSTFAFCVWTAVHPDVIPNASGGYRLFYKGFLMLASITAPEAIAVFAIGQLKAARTLKKEWDVYVKNKDLLREGSFDMAVAFFIVMGGFAIDVSNQELDRNVSGGITEEEREKRRKSAYTATLTPSGFVKYLKEGYFDDCPFKEHSRAIKDKGKANNFAKTLSVAQALWLVVQWVGRMAGRLPVRYSCQVP